MESAERVRMCQRLLQEVAAPWVQELGMQVESADERELHLVVPVRPALVHGGGVLCGQAMMAAAETAIAADEEKARNELGMLRPDEVLVQLTPRR